MTPAFRFPRLVLCIGRMAFSCFISGFALITLWLSVASGQDTAPFRYSPLGGDMASLNESDLSALMVRGIDSFLTGRTHEAAENRARFWARDFSSEEAFDQSVFQKREALKEILGVTGRRVPDPRMTTMSVGEAGLLEVTLKDCIVRGVRWEVLGGSPGLSAEGLLIRPKKKIRARVVMIPDADTEPEVLAGLLHPGNAGFGIGKLLADAGCEVLIPVLVNRQDTFSGNPRLNLYTNQPHREWIYRQGYEVGRHVIGYELQKIFSAIDWMEIRNKAGGDKLPIGVAGYGEGGALALYSAALDNRISSTLVSGYFDVRDNLWQEPIYRNVFGLLKYFGDAELAVMAWPRHLVIEQSEAPEVSGPPAPAGGRSGATPGRLTTPDFSSARSEWNRAVSMLPENSMNMNWCAAGTPASGRPYSPEALRSFAGGLKINLPKDLSVIPAPVRLPVKWADTLRRQQRAVSDMQEVIQQEVILCEQAREKTFWDLLKGKDEAAQRPVKSALREKFWDQIGKLPTPSMPVNPRAKLIHKGAKWSTYEVVLDVWEGVFAWGLLLVPNHLEEGAKYPVVVCQHGLEGLPADVVTTDPDAANYHFYQGFASRLADRGYVVFAPSNLYRGEDTFRVLQRKANPLGLTLFSVMIGQHQRIVEWLQQLSFVDSSRIGFYGLSYGGKTAMRVPPVVDGYSLVICSGDFNEWIRKCASTDYAFSYLFIQEYDMYEWDLGHTFNYAEMAALTAPRPFMVERGHFDGVARDEWVGYEYAKVKRHYDLIGLPEQTRIEFFKGPHTIHGEGTFQFLDRFLKPGSSAAGK